MTPSTNPNTPLRSGGVLIGLLALALGAASFIVPAMLHRAPPCTSRDINTINGNPACRIPGADNTSVHSK